MEEVLRQNFSARAVSDLQTGDGELDNSCFLPPASSIWLVDLTPLN